jgi:glutaredoxin
MKKYSLKIFTLKSCPHCAALKNNLKNENIDFMDSTCEDDPVSCDKIEEVTGSDLYPMAILETKSKTYAIYQTNNHNELGEKPKDTNGIYKIACYSIDNMLFVIKKQLN